MREAINAGVRVARGEYIMRTDEHCAFAKGFDEAMTSVCQDNWIMTATRYFLDPKEWKIMDHKEVVITEKLGIQTVKNSKKFTGKRWHELDKKYENTDIVESMAMQGSCWVMPRTWWDKVIKELQTEGYGPLLQDSHEMVFKTWKAGGHLMVNKKTWFAHKHVSFKRTHQASYNKEHLDYSYNKWKDYYKEIRKKWSV